VEFFLQVVGGFVLAIVLILVSIYIFFKIKFGKYLNYDADENQTPLHIHLNEDVSPDWLNKSAVKKVSKELDSLGFISGKSYFIYEMEGYFLKAYIKGTIVVVMYWHEITGCWVDMVVEEIDGMEYTVSNAPMGGQMSERPDCIKTFNSKATITDLNNDINFIVDKSSKHFVKINADNFREYFEDAFKKDISWKNRNGGISYEEFIATEKNEVPFRNSKKNIEEAFIVIKESELYQWHEAALEEYRVNNDITDDDFYSLVDQMLIVPFLTNATAFIRYLSSQCFIEEHQEKSLIKEYASETDIMMLFDKLNEFLSPELRAKHIADVAYPLPVRLYKMSEKMSA